MELSFPHYRRPGRLRNQAVSSHPLKQMRRPNVRSHDDDRILEIHCTSLSIRESTIIQNLEERIENVRMRLIDLVDRITQYGRRRTASVNCPPSSSPTYPGGAPRSLYTCVPFHVFVHIDPDHILFTVEKGPSKRPGQFRLTDSGKVPGK